MSEKFSIEMIEQTFTSYKKGQLFDGVVVLKRDDGVIFNIGGKNDAFIPKADFENYSLVKIGDRFKVLITNSKNEEGLIEVSKSEADSLTLANQNASRLKLGSKFSFVPTKANNEGLFSKMGEYSIFIPFAEISSGFIKDVRNYVGKQLDATVTELDKENKTIIASVKLLADQIRETNETLFWNSIFLNKLVKGQVKKILSYGAIIEVGGVGCFLHISNISYNKIEKIEDVLSIGQELNFKVIEVDRQNKRVALSLKALEISPKKKAIEELEVGEKYKGTVVKLLKFGAIVKLENGASGLLHISNATEDKQAQIYQIVKLDQEVEVQVIDKDAEEERVSFKLN